VADFRFRLIMKKTNKTQPNKVTIQSCDKLLGDFFSLTLDKQKDLDPQTVQVLRDLYKKGQLTADNITKTLQEKRTKLYE